MDKINPKNSTENLFVLEDLGWFEILPQYSVYMVLMGEFYLSQHVRLPKPEGTCTQTSVVHGPRTLCGFRATGSYPVYS